MPGRSERQAQRVQKAIQERLDLLVRLVLLDPQERRGFKGLPEWLAQQGQQARQVPRVWPAPKAIPDLLDRPELRARKAQRGLRVPKA
jgi:hypothetical protein